jgi:arsenate reductase
MNRKTTVLFVCIHNSARSQMAEAFLNSLGSDRFEARSAGLEPGRLNPLVVKAMREEGIDISGKETTSVDKVIASGAAFDYLITVCDETSAERCPFIPGTGKRLHWGFPDPSVLSGSDEEKLAETRVIRDRIRDRIGEWLLEFPHAGIHSHR